jgi:hypothetical protein
MVRLWRPAAKPKKCDLLFLGGPFDPVLCVRSKRRRASQMAVTMGTLWSRFAKFGSPNGAVDATTAAAGGLAHWPKYNANSDLYMEIKQPLEVKAGLRKEQCDFWDRLPRQDGYPPTRAL